MAHHKIAPRIPYVDNPSDFVRAVDLALMVIGTPPEVVAYRRGVLDGIRMTAEALLKHPDFLHVHAQETT